MKTDTLKQTKVCRRKYNTEKVSNNLRNAVCDLIVELQRHGDDLGSMMMFESITEIINRIITERRERLKAGNSLNIPEFTVDGRLVWVENQVNRPSIQK